MIKARLRLTVPNSTISKSLLDAVGPDNTKMPGLNVIGRAKPRFAEFRMAFDGRIETFIFTLDDMLRCLQAAERTLKNIARENVE